MKGIVKRLLREGLLDEVSNEDEMSVYFNMVNKELDGYIKYLNNTYLSLADISIIDVLNMEYDQFKTFERNFEDKVDKIFNFIREYNKKTNDFPEEDKYSDEMDAIYKMELRYRGKEEMLTKIFYAMGEINKVKDEFDNHPFDDAKPFNIG